MIEKIFKCQLKSYLSSIKSTLVSLQIGLKSSPLQDGSSNYSSFAVDFFWWRYYIYMDIIDIKYPKGFLPSLICLMLIKIFQFNKTAYGYWESTWGKN